MVHITFILYPLFDMKPADQYPHFYSLNTLTLIFCFDSLCLSQQFFSHAGMGLTRLYKYQAVDKVSCSRTHHSDSAGGEAQTSNPLIPSLTLYQPSHSAPHTLIETAPVDCLEIRSSYELQHEISNNV